MLRDTLVFFCILCIFAILPAQSADQTRLNVRIFPLQSLSVQTTNDLNAEQRHSDPAISAATREITVSSVYGYQIKVLGENDPSSISSSAASQKKLHKNCGISSRLLYVSNIPEINRIISLTNISSKDNDVTEDWRKKKEVSNLYVYTIITQ